MSAMNDFHFSDHGYGATHNDPELEDLDSINYVSHLTQAWINERAAPDILQYEQLAVDGLLAKIEEQVSFGAIPL